MNIDQLKKGKQLLEVINTTKIGIKELKSLVDKRDNSRTNDIYDGQYNLSILEHSDGSGRSARLSRSLGNAKLLDVIINELEVQLETFEKEFEEL